MQLRLMILVRVRTQLWEDRRMEGQPFRLPKLLRTADIPSNRTRNQHLAAPLSMAFPQRRLGRQFRERQCSQAMEGLHRTAVV